MDKAQKVILTKEELDSLKASLSMATQQRTDTLAEYTNYKTATVQQMAQLTNDKIQLAEDKENMQQQLEDLHQRLDASEKTLSSRVKESKEQIEALHADASKHNKENTAKEHSFNEEIIKLKAEQEALNAKMAEISAQKDPGYAEDHSTERDANTGI